jgi:hypothetical protein
LQAIDVFAGEHRVGGTAVIARFDLAVGADQYVGQQLASWQQSQRQGEGGEFHG